MRFRLHRVVVVALIAMAALVPAGCGGDESGGAEQVFGDYPTQRIDGDYDETPSRARGILAESIRLGERIVYGGAIEPTLTAGRGGGVIVDHRGVTDTLSGAQRSALDKYNVIAGYSALAADRPYAQDNNPEGFLSVALIELPDEQTAAAAAADMERADFTVNEANAPVAVTAYPTALSHWRPGVSSLGTWMASKSMVIRVLATTKDPDLGRLVDIVTRTLRQQVANLDGFVPTPVADLPAAKLDSDKLLTRIVKTGDYSPDAWNFAVYRLHAYSIGIRNPMADEQALQALGVTSIAVSYNKYLFRLADASKSEQFVQYLASGTTDFDYQSMTGIPGNTSVSCYQATKTATRNLAARHFRCVITHGEFVVEVYSDQDLDARRLAAAQYALLASAA
ncbi:DUF7373 family lipoprotein [Nocardia jejuensis]|uniref:DUF7373 family lipoprotein n=1 Tax=Nocardia jejuensis TaxID=328049 RepID=UPI00082E4F95|nr:hypothetical protein [Nocardia jejuensis]